MSPVRTAAEQRDDLRALMGITLATMEMSDPDRFGDFVATAQKMLDRIAAELAEGSQQ